MIDLRHVRHFLAVASHPTVQAAADAIHLSQPALTKSVARFEEQLGAQLFDRRGHKLVLTELGERLVARGEGLLRHALELEEEVALWKGLGTGEVSIGVDPAVELSLLPLVLKTFMPAHPHVKVTVRSGHVDALLPSLLGGKLHFLVADADLALTRDDLDIRRLTAEPIVMALRPGHPLSQKLTPKQSDVRSYPIAGGTHTPRFVQWVSERARQEGEKPHEPDLICDNYEVLIRLAECSDTIVYGPRSVLANYQTMGRVNIMPWPVTDGLLTNPGLIRSKGRHLSPAAEKLMQLFLTSVT